MTEEWAGGQDTCAQVSGAGGLDEGDAIQVEKSGVDLGPLYWGPKVRNLPGNNAGGWRSHVKVAREAGGKGQQTVHFWT